MVGQNPQIVIARPQKGNPMNGVLPISASQTNPQAAAPRSGPSRSAGPRLKVVIRRLPPGLTQAELETYLGDDWKVSGGRVDWMIFRPGKVSKDPVKVSTPSRVYIHLADPGHLASLSTIVLQTSFLDAKNTAGSASLLGPPSVEFAPYGRTPSGKRRTDARQGTIDQDPEFIAFLESLTNPTTKKAADTPAGVDGSGKKEEKVTITPLVQYLKEKKAAKAKDSSSPAKSSKSRQESRDSRSDKNSEKKILAKPNKETSLSPEVKKGGRDREKKVQKATTEAVKVLNREASATGAKGKAAATPAPVTSASKDGDGSQGKAPSAPATERRRERGTASLAAKILQRDLGLAGTPPRRSGVRREPTGDGAKSEASPQTVPPSPGKQDGTPSASAENTKPPAGPTPVTRTPSFSQSNEHEGSRRPNRSERRAHRFANEKSSQVPSNAPTGPTGAPLASLKKSTTSIQQQRQDISTAPKGPSSANRPPPPLTPTMSAPPTLPSASKPTASLPAVTPGATQAFCKHANASQGVTEPALREAMEAIAPIVKVEIDKKKGFGYVEFANTEGLVNAIKASPVKVGNGSVVVLEKKERPAAGGGPAGGVGNIGGFPGRGRGGPTGGMGPASPGIGGGRGGALDANPGRGGGMRGGRGRPRGGPQPPRGPAAMVNPQGGAPVAIAAPPTGPAADAT